MSDFSIPGTGTSKYGTDKLIEGLMKVERVPRDRAAKELESDKTKKTVWLDLNQKLTGLRNDARNIFGSQNPFMARVAKSSNEDVLTATASRTATEQTRSILVRQEALADRFLSSDLAKDYKIPAGDYVFGVGDKTIELNYAGGNLEDFAGSLTRKGRDLVKASVVTVVENTKSLVFESQQQGLKNRLTFQKDAEKLALDLGVLERVTTRSRSLDLSRPSDWEARIDPALVKADKTQLSVSTGGQARLRLDAPVKTDGLVLELKYRLAAVPEDPVPVPPPGPSLGPVGEASFEGITIRGAASESGLAPWTPPSGTPRVDDKVMAFTVAPDGSYRPLPALADSTEAQTMTVELKPYGTDLAALAFRDKDTGRRLEVLSARVFDPAETGGYKPKRPISTARDAVLAMDGIEVTRSKNQVDDLIPGVTLNLKASGDKPVSLKIEPDRKAVKDAIIALVGNYNRFQGQVNILTRGDEAIISEITYLTDDEKKTAKDRLGLLLNNSTLTMLRTSLQAAIANPYETGTDLRLLAQAGISTNAQKAGSSQGYDATKMRGYLEIDEDTLDKTLASNFQGVERLLGYDSDGDLIKDSGAAWKIAAIIDPYVNTGGILSNTMSTLDRQITQEKSKLETLDKQLADKEAELKAKYATMEGTLNQMDSSSSAIDNFSKQNSGQ